MHRCHPTVQKIAPYVISVLISPSVFCSHVFATDVDFNRDIRPLLSNNCFHCHGPDSSHREADLRLDIEDDAKTSAIIPGDLESELLARVTSEEHDLVMPPPESDKKLTADEIELLKRWIEQGAPWAQHWAYVVPEQHPIPVRTAVKNDSETENDSANGNWIDNFILERLSEEELVPAEHADNLTLIRRLYFDLTGLPPTPEQVEQFANDDDPAAYETLVDQLLDSPHFGERMAVYWLDLVRYADTVGYHGDQDQNISPYRDYVIDAFNRNLPFDQFTREQLAGDLLDSPTIDQKVATGYNRMLQTSHEGGVQPKEYLAIYQADRVRNVSAVWMGATLGCAQCHDHKYDPYTAKDFYAMAAYFADIDETEHFTKGTNSLPTARPPEIDVFSRLDRKRYAAVTERLKQIRSLKASTGEQNQLELNELESEKKQLEKRRRRTMITVALAEPREVRLLPRGNWLDESGDVLEPAVPSFLQSLSRDELRGDSTRDATADRSPPANRLDLANWLVDSQNGSGLLTARVMANRFWYLLFGAGLSESLEDFGGQGKPPVHPELLDNLAIDFATNGWDVKRLIKLITMSQTYRRSSLVAQAMLDKDPDNLLFARQSSYRLPAEMVRDTALAAADLLVDEFGGPSVKPYQPVGYYRHLNFPQRRYAHHGDQRQWRRGVYVHWQRQFLHPMLRAFDAPTREECTAKRPRSNTPLAALVLLNDPTFVEAARGLAYRLLTEGIESEQDETSSDHARIERAYRIVVSREPEQLERETLIDLLHASRSEYKRDPEQSEALLVIGEKRHEGVDANELAAWTSVARTILNLSEATTRP